MTSSWSSTNELHNDFGILKVCHIYEASVITFAVKCLQWHCPPCINKLFQNLTQPVWNKTKRTTRISPARIECGYSGVQYRAADPWNQIGSNFKTILDRNTLKDPFVKCFIPLPQLNLLARIRYMCLFISILHFIIYLRKKTGMTLRKFLYANLS